MQQPSPPERRGTVLLLAACHQGHPLSASPPPPAVAHQDVEFVDAPHELPLADGQAVPMRAWWRHWALDSSPRTHSDSEQGGAALSLPLAGGALGDASAAGASATLGAGVSDQQPDSARSIGCSSGGSAHQAQVAAALAAGWGPRMAADWGESLEGLVRHWAERGPYDGLLGFSNGAAAAFLFAAHAVAAAAAAQQAGGDGGCGGGGGDGFGALQFVIAAGGYVPKPLDLLAPPALLRAGGGREAGGARLAAPVPLASLHVVSPADPLVPLEDGLALADCFAAGSR